MKQKHSLALALGFTFFLIGYFIPHSILLDLPFGLAQYVVEVLGYWDASPLWVKEYGWLSTLCYFGYPLLFSILLGYGAAFVTLKLRGEGDELSRWRAGAFLFALFCLILFVRAEPGTLHISNYAHWTMHF